MQSKEAAWIYSGNEVSQVALFFLLPFVGRVKKRPLWVGLMNVVAAVGVFIIALPQFISPKYTIQQGRNSEKNITSTQPTQLTLYRLFLNIAIIRAGEESSRDCAQNW
jgi:hypothetical protein